MNRRASRAELMAALAARREKVYAYVNAALDRYPLRSRHLGAAAASYVRRPGKGLRSGVLLLSCAATGGDEARAVPAAASVELFHVWTLVHDDVIDQDDVRRGRPTVHAEFTARAGADLGLTGQDAAHYGLTQAVLAGDVQQGWSAALLTEAATRRGASAALVLSLVAELFGSVESHLVDGEALDVELSLRPPGTVGEDETLDMIEKKTGALYAYAALAGACLGLGTWQPADPAAAALAAFGRNCGIAFQLQDDVLGAVGDAAVTGKPVGADLREGKPTLIVGAAWRNATDAQRSTLSQALGNRAATDAQIRRATRLLQDLGGVKFARSRAQAYVAEAHDCLAAVPQSPARSLLHALADYVLARDA